MLKSNRCLIRPLEIMPENFYTNKKYGSHYYEKSINLIDKTIDRFDFVYEHNDYVELENPNSYIEDVEKVLYFLNNYDYLNLVTVLPTYEDVLNMIYYDNRYEKGELKTNITAKRNCVGQLETSRFEEILSKEISDKLFKMGETVSNSMKPEHIKNNNMCFAEKEEMLKIIENGLYYMNFYSEVNPNTILINDEIYEKLFDEKINEFNYITKTDKLIYGLNVWINPHSKDLLLYNNTNDNKIITNKFNKQSVIFSPFCLFAKKDGEVDTNKYHHLYALTEIGFFPYKNFFLIYNKY